MAQNPEDRDLVEGLAELIVADVAPEELDLFDELVDEYYDDPTPPDPNARASDDVLGFGLGETLIAITPAATAMVSVIVGFVMQTAIEAFRDESAEFAREKVKEFFKKATEKKKKNGDAKPADSPPADPDATVVNDAQTAVVPLDQGQLKQVRELAYNEAKRFGVSDEEATAMADALLRRLVLSE